MEYQGQTRVPRHLFLAIGSFLGALIVQVSLLAGWASPAGAAVDLRVASVVYGSPLPGPVAGQEFPVVVTIANDGDEIAGPFPVAIWTDSAAEPTDPATADNTKMVDGLAPGTEHEVDVKFYVTYPAVGTYTFWAWADAGGHVSDPDSTNNKFDVLVTASDNLPDLVIDDIVPDNDKPMAGERFTMAVTIKNQGNVEAGPCRLAVWNDNPIPATDATDADQDMDIEGVAAGQTQTVNIAVTYDRPGSYTFRVLADADQGIDEINEHNNGAAITVPIVGYANILTLLHANGMCGAQGAQNLPVLGLISAMGLVCMSSRRKEWSR